MLYQVGFILLLVVLALIVGKKLKSTNSVNEQLVYEDDMSEEELEKLDDEIN